MKLLSSAALLLLAALQAAAQPVLPPCGVNPKLTVTRKPVTAGHLTTIHVGVKNTGAPLTGLNVEVVLPSNCCFAKGKASPSLAKTGSPTPKQPIVIGQNVYWLDWPLGANKGRSFHLKVRVSSLFTAPTTVPITAFVYATNATGQASCVNRLDSTVRGVCGWILRMID